MTSLLLTGKCKEHVPFAWKLYHHNTYYSKKTLTADQEQALKTFVEDLLWCNEDLKKVHAADVILEGNVFVEMMGVQKELIAIVGAFTRIGYIY